MLTSSPWVQPTDVLAAMEGGSRAGQAQRSAQDQETEAAQRLRLSYDSLAQDQAVEKQKMAMQQNQALAAQALRAQQQNALMQFRDQEIKNQQDKQAQAVSASEAAMGLRERAQADRESEYDRTATARETAAAALSAGNQAHLEAQIDMWNKAAQDKEKSEADRQTAAAEKNALELQLEKMREDAKAKQGEGADKSYMDIPPQSDEAGKKFSLLHLPLNSPLINSTLGTNAPPGTGTNFPSAAAALKRGSPALPGTDAATPPAPNSPSQRQTGTVYLTPKGAMVWMGNGWAPTP